jgi:hypothetical protein
VSFENSRIIDQGSAFISCGTNGRLNGSKIPFRLVSVRSYVFDQGLIKGVLGAQESGDHRRLARFCVSPRESQSLMFGLTVAIQECRCAAQRQEEEQSERQQ